MEIYFGVKDNKDYSLSQIIGIPKTFEMLSTLTHHYLFFPEVGQLESKLIITSTCSSHRKILLKQNFDEMSDSQ